MATGLAIAPLAVAVYGAQHGAIAPRTVVLAPSGAIAIISLAISIIPIGAIALGTLALAQHAVNPLLLCMRHEVGTHERRGWYPKNSRAPLLLKLRPAAAAAAAAAAGAGIGIGALISHAQHGAMALISHAIIRNHTQSGALISHAIIRNQAVIRGGGGEVPVSIG